MATVTIQSLTNDYLSYLQAQNSQINAYSPNSFWEIDAGAMAGILLDLYANLSLIQNSIYPQTSVGQQVDQWLYSRGLPARGGLTYGTINCTVTSSTPVIIPINTIFTDTSTQNKYETLQALTVSSGVQIITLYSTVAGNNIIEPIGNILSDGTSIYTVIVTSSTNGQLEESDQSCITRILMAIRIPQAGARQSDYYNYALASNVTLPAPVITDAIIVPGFYSFNAINALGDFVLVGTFITEYQLNQGLLPATTFVGYSRQAGSDVITNTNNYIQSLRLVGFVVLIGTSITDIITSGINQLILTVSLVSGYVLSTEIVVQSQDNNDNPITVTLTVKQLIQRELRRAICNQPYGATPINGQNYITIDSLLYSVNLQLSAINGQLAQILTNIQIAGGDIPVPNFDYNAENLYYTYDIDAYSNIVVNQI